MTVKNRPELGTLLNLPSEFGTLALSIDYANAIARTLGGGR